MLSDNSKWRGAPEGGAAVMLSNTDERMDRPNSAIVTRAMVTGGYGLAQLLTKYQFSGLMPSVVDCGSTPRRLLTTSVSWYTPFGCQMTGSWADR